MKKDKGKNWLLIILVVIIAIWLLPTTVASLWGLICVGFSFLGAIISVGFWVLVAWLLWKLWKKA